MCKYFAKKSSSKPFQYIYISPTLNLFILQNVFRIVVHRNPATIDVCVARVEHSEWQYSSIVWIRYEQQRMARGWIWSSRIKRIASLRLLRIR